MLTIPLHKPFNGFIEDNNDSNLKSYSLTIATFPSNNATAGAGVAGPRSVIFCPEGQASIVQSFGANPPPISQVALEAITCF